MKEKVLDCDLRNDLQVVITRLSDEAYLEMEPRVSINIECSAVMLLQQRMRKDALNVAQSYWALRNLFGAGGRFFDTRKCAFSFPLGLEVNKSGLRSRYVTNLTDFGGDLEFTTFKLLSEDEVRDGCFDPRIFNEPVDAEFSAVDFNHFVNFFNGFLGGYLKSQQPEPIFFFRHIAAVGAIYGFRDGVYFDDRHETEEEYRAALAGLEEEAVRQGGEEIPPIWEAEKDDILDYQGFSRFETGLIRRGEARILLRQLVHRFGDAAKILEGVLERSSARQLADLSEIALEARVLDEVLVFCQAHLQLDLATSAEAIGSDISDAG